MPTETWEGKVLGVRCPAPHNNKASGCGRLEAAFVPTGHEQDEDQN